MVPALELIDARIEQADRVTKAPRKVLDTIADDAANGAIITGGRPMKPDAVDWRWAGAMLNKNGQIEGSGLGAAVLTHPEPDVKAAIEDGFAKILAAGEAPGILAVDEPLARRDLKLGARFVAVGVEATLLARAARGLAERFGRGSGAARSAAGH